MNRIAELRKARGMSQTVLARLAGTNALQISRLETGRTRLSADWLSRIARALECEPQELLPGGESAPSYAGLRAQLERIEEKIDKLLAILGRRRAG